MTACHVEIEVPNNVPAGEQRPRAVTESYVAPALSETVARKTVEQGAKRETRGDSPLPDPALTRQDPRARGKIVRVRNHLQPTEHKASPLLP